jgi:two-component system, NtrC family, sensor kinase
VLNAADAIKESANKDAGLIGLSTALVSSPDNRQTLLQVSIADNGVGIPDTLLDTVFDPFFTTKEPGAGTGLGLSVSLALIESMGGRMNIQSAPGQGTTVCVLLPLATEDAHGAEKSEAFAQ